MKKITLFSLTMLVLVTSSLQASFTFTFNNQTNSVLQISARFTSGLCKRFETFTLQPHENQQKSFGFCKIDLIEITDSNNPMNNAKWSGADITGGSFNFTTKDGKLIIIKG